jgi:hypothetical protein
VTDFDLDGNADMAVANEGSNDVSVLLGTGSAFAAPLNFATGVPGAAPLSVVTADFNKDNYPDVAVADSGSDRLSVLLSRAPELNFSPSPVAFGAQPVAGPPVTKTVTAANRSQQTLIVTGPAQVNGADSGDYKLARNTCPSVLPPGSSCEFDVTFVAGALGERVGALYLPTTGPDSRDIVQLTGRGAVFDDATPPDTAAPGRPAAEAAAAITTKTAPKAKGKAKKCVVPKLKGKTLKQVKKALKKARCKLGKVTKKRARGKKGRVILQKPAAKKKLKVGTKVRITVRA